ATELGHEAQDPEHEVPPALALLGAGGLPAADLTAVEVEEGADLERLVLNGDVAAVVVGDDVTALEVLGGESVPGEIDVLVRAAATQLQVEQAAEDAGLEPEQVAALTNPTPPSTRLLDAQPAG